MEVGVAYPAIQHLEGLVWLGAQLKELEYGDCGDVPPPFEPRETKKYEEEMDEHDGERAGELVSIHGAILCRSTT
ncbi:hypothetical protein CRG98_018145 [Punica granatum]|uniref:Uncharacterized protein n=1 Tax=Punica granatum TaxID=22663 RepID=A0A2I0JYY6_PUNGR|nr:hypothetical protein CRG98_018145 [Punica granatum]